MELELRALKKSDWETLCKWWESWGWPIIDKEILPLNGTGGLMVYKGDQCIAAGFLYLTNSKAAWLDWIVSSKEYKDKDRGLALDKLISGLEEVARAQGNSMVISITRSNSLIKKHKKLGYVVDDSPSFEVSKKLN